MNRSSSSLPPLVFAALIGSLAAFGLWFWACLPVNLEEEWGEKLASASFAPFREGQSPLDKIYPSEEEVRRDLEIVATLSNGIRTYTAREGLERVPEFAEKLGLSVTFGAWLTSEVEEKGRRINEGEVKALILAANRYPDAVDRVIVGNEVLLRNDLPPEKLIAYIREVKQAVAQPVSYADVWAFFLQYPEVGREVDFLTIHILPFWEDEPVAIDDVEAHVIKIVNKMRAAFPGKPILIGEAGWPSLGRDRGPAHVSTVNQARFVRKMARLAEENRFDYNIVEAFDQPWKAALENTVGAAWGIWDIDRVPKFALSGPVSEVPDWRLRAAIAIFAGALVGVWGGRKCRSFARKLTLALMAQIMAWLAVTACFHAEAVSFGGWQSWWAPVRGAVASAMGLLIMARASLLMQDEREGAGRFPGGSAFYLLVCVYALVWAALLIFNGRYRDIPVIDFASASAGVAMLAALEAAFALRQGRRASFSAEKMLGRAAFAPIGLVNLLWKALAVLLPLAAAASLIGEGVAITGKDFAMLHPEMSERIPLVLRAMVSNFETNLWAAMLMALSIPAIGSVLRDKREKSGRLS